MKTKNPSFVYPGWATTCAECDAYATRVDGNDVYCDRCGLFRGKLKKEVAK